MKKKIWGIATALTLAVGCSLFLPHSVWAAEDTVIIKQNARKGIPNGEPCVNEISPYEILVYYSGLK